MLQDIRQNIQGTMAKIIIGLIVISFSIFGIESLLFSPATTAVAEVNGKEISPFDLQQEVSVLQRQILSMLGDNADPSLLDSAVMTDQALQSLVQRTLLTGAAESMNLAVSEAALGQLITAMEEFQVNGQFSTDLFQSRLATAGFTPASFRQRLSEDLVQAQLRAGLAGSAFVTGSELASAARIAAEGRDLRYITIPVSRFRDDLNISDEDVSAFFAANQDRFTSEESLDIEYVELSIDSYREPVEEERIREEFELVRGEYELAEESRVSHILFEGDEDERAARLAEAQSALASGRDFADAAQAFSDDIGSADAGGDLGYTAGDTFPEEMEEAIAQLAVGETGAVETDAGTHLLLVTDRREGSSVSFDDVRFELEERLQTADAAASLLIDVERLRDIAFNAADLTEPAEELAVEIQRAQSVVRGQSEGLFADPRLVRAAFSEDVLEAGHNSEVIELSPELFVLLRVAQRNPPEPLPLAAVRGEIERELREEQAQAQAREAAYGILEQLAGGESVENVANAADLDWQVELGARRDSDRLPPSLRERLFALVAPAAGSTVREVVVDIDTLYVMEMMRVTPGAMDSLSPAELLALRQRLSSDAANLLLQQYETALRADAEILVY